MVEMFTSVRFIFFCCFILGQWCLPTLCYTQDTGPDTAFLALAKRNSIALYTQALQHQSRLYNGSDYSLYQSLDEEHPYFKVDDWTNGSIIYEEDLYDNIPIQYDIRVDKVITENDRGNAIQLLDEKIERFSIFDRTFVRLTKDDASNVTTGFYDQLYKGNVGAYARHKKVYQESLEQGAVIPRFDENTHYYIVKDGTFHSVKTKASVLNVFSDRKQNVKDFMRKNRIRFKTDRETAIKRIAEFYDTLIK